MRIIGAAEGVIMPTIITVHMANTNANSIARQVPPASVRFAEAEDQFLKIHSYASP
jgi:hypothetical protein